MTSDLQLPGRRIDHPFALPEGHEKAGFLPSAIWTFDLQVEATVYLHATFFVSTNNKQINMSIQLIYKQ